MSSALLFKDTVSLVALWSLEIYLGLHAWENLWRRGKRTNFQDLWKWKCENWNSANLKIFFSNSPENFELGSLLCFEICRHKFGNGQMRVFYYWSMHGLKIADSAIKSFSPLKHVFLATGPFLDNRDDLVNVFPLTLKNHWKVYSSLLLYFWSVPMYTLRGLRNQETEKKGRKTVFLQGISASLTLSVLFLDFSQGWKAQNTIDLTK